MQGVLGEYVHAEMLFHAKALELHTAAFRSLQGISEEETAQVCSFMRLHCGVHIRYNSKFLCSENFVKTLRIMRMLMFVIKIVIVHGETTPTVDCSKFL